MQTYFLNLEHKLHSLIESSPTFSANPSRQEQIIQQPSHSRYVSQQNMLDFGVSCIDMIEDESTLVYGFASCAGPRKWVVGLVYFSKHDGAYRMKQVATFPWKVTCCRFVRSINCQCFVVGGEHGHAVRLTFQHRDRVEYKVMRVSVWSVVELKPLYVKGKKPYLLVVTLDELIVVVDVEEWALRQKFVPVMLQMLRSAEHALINNITILTHPAHPIYLIQGCHYGTIRVWQLIPSSLSSPSASSNQSQQSVQIISGRSTKQTEQTQRKKVKITLFPKTIINSIYPEGLIWIQLYGLLLVAITKQYQLVFTALQIKGEIVSESYEHLVRYPLLQLPCMITDVKCFPQYSAILYSVHTSTGFSSVYVLTLNQYYKPDRQVRIKSKNLNYVRGMLISQSGQFLLMHNTSQIMISFEEGLLAPPRVY